MTKDIMTKKANYSMMINDEYSNLEVYRGYALDPNDKKAFHTKKEVDEYLNALLEEMSQFK